MLSYVHMSYNVTCQEDDYMFPYMGDGAHLAFLSGVLISGIHSHLL